MISIFAAPLIFVEFRNNTAFATCSEDKMIYVCSFGESQPVYAFSEHQVSTLKSLTNMLKFT